MPDISPPAGQLVLSRTAPSVTVGPLVRYGPKPERWVYAFRLSVYDTEAGVERVLYVAEARARAIDWPALGANDIVLKASVVAFIARIYPFGPGAVGWENGEEGAALGNGSTDGTIEIDDVGGAMSRMRFWAWTGRAVDAYYGIDGSPWSAMRQVASLAIAEKPSTGPRWAFTLRPRGYVDSGLVGQRVLLGTGGDEGTAEVAGRPRPVAHGRTRNAEPLLVNNSTGKRQHHDGRVQGSGAAYDGGASDTGTFDDEKGYFTPGAEPALRQTIDILGCAPKNEVADRDDLTTANWTKGGAPATTAARYRGPDAVDNSGSLVTFNAANGTISQTLAGLSGKSVMASWYAQEEFGDAVFEATLDGSAWTAIPLERWTRYEMTGVSPTQIGFRASAAGYKAAIFRVMVETPDPPHASYPHAGTAASQVYKESACEVVRELACQRRGRVPFLDTEETSYDTVDALVTLPAPASACVAALAGAGAGNVTAGNHSWKITFVNNAGETVGSAKSNVLNVTSPGTNGKVNLSSVPLGDPEVTARKVYRTVAGDTGAWKLVGTIADNTTTTFQDNIADGSLGADAPTAGTARPAIGLYLTGGERIHEAIARALWSIGAVEYHGADGKARVARLTAPAVTPDLDIDEGDLRDFAVLADRQPVGRSFIGYQRNHTVMRGEFAAGLSAARKQFLAFEFRTTAAVETASVIEQWGETEDAVLRIDTLLDSKAMAESERDRRHAMHSVPTLMARATLPGPRYKPWDVDVFVTLGITRKLVTYGAEDAPARRSLRVTGFEFGMDGASHFVRPEMWG